MHIKSIAIATTLLVSSFSNYAWEFGFNISTASEDNCNDYDWHNFNPQISYKTITVKSGNEFTIELPVDFDRCGYNQDQWSLRMMPDYFTGLSLIESGHATKTKFGAFKAYQYWTFKAANFGTVQIEFEQKARCRCMNGSKKIIYTINVTMF